MKSLIHHLLICAADRNCTCVIYIDLNACLVDNGIDGFSSLAYHVTNLLRIDLDLDDFRCVLIHMISGSRNTFLHNF